jgi:hypothetical protein
MSSPAREIARLTTLVNRTTVQRDDANRHLEEVTRERDAALDWIDQLRREYEPGYPPRNTPSDGGGQ